MRRDKAIKYFKLAKFQANLFSKDQSKKVGALFLAPGSLQILSQGYNGMSRGINETLIERWERPVKYKFVEHAERNAIYNACRHGTPLKDSICIVTMFCCSDCARALIQVGIKTLITVPPDYNNERWGEDFEYSMIMFNEVNIDIIFLEEDELL